MHKNVFLETSLNRIKTKKCLNIGHGYNNPIILEGNKKISNNLSKLSTFTESNPI